MDAQQFTYWLQGFAELNEAPPTLEQWRSIREHLATVFLKVTPPYQPNRGERPETVKADPIDPSKVPPVKPLDLREINRRMQEQRDGGPTPIWPPPTGPIWSHPVILKCTSGTLRANDGAATTC